MTMLIQSPGTRPEQGPRLKDGNGSAGAPVHSAQCPWWSGRKFPGLCPTAWVVTLRRERHDRSEHYKHAQRELMEEAKSIAGVAEVAEVYARIAPAVDDEVHFANVVNGYSTGANETA